MKFINKYRSPNFNERKNDFSIKYIIIHYTAMKNEHDALEYLCSDKNKVSSHFLINKEGLIYYLVDLNFRAWHAGESYWKNERDINSNSIGIELDNLGLTKYLKKYTNKQMLSLKKLLSFLKKEYSINNYNILGHSDIAPYRKIDPGPHFPWYYLSKFKISYFPNLISYKLINTKDCMLKINKDRYNRAIFFLSEIGFNSEPAKKNSNNFYLLIKAYQMHYRPSLTSGILDEETFKIIHKHYKHLLTIQ